VSNLKSELVKQNEYVASLKKKLAQTSKHVQEHAEELEELQIRLDNLEQYLRKNSLEFCGIANEVGPWSTFS